MAAAASGPESSMQLLLDAGADVNGSSDAIERFDHTGYENALSQAVGFGIENWSFCPLTQSTHIIHKLLHAGADIHAGGDAALWKAVHYRADRGHNWESSITLTQFLLANGADVNGQYTDPEGRPRNSILWGVDNVDLAKILLDHGAEVNGPSHTWYSWKTDQSALHRAAAVRNKDLVRLLLDHGANVNFVDPSDALYLVMAAFVIHQDLDHKGTDAIAIMNMMIDAILSAEGQDAAIIGKMLEIEDSEGEQTWRHWTQKKLEQLISEGHVRSMSLRSTETNA